MGSTTSKIDRIHDNQLNIPDLVLIKIIKYLNNDCRNQNLNATNLLKLSLVSTYWMIHIIPKSTLRITISYDCTKFIKSYPQSLKRITSRVINSQTTTTTSAAAATIIDDEYISNQLALYKITLVDNTNYNENNRSNKINTFEYFKIIKTIWKQCKSITLVGIQRGFLVYQVFNEAGLELDNLRVYPNNIQGNLIQDIYSIPASNFAIHMPYSTRFNRPEVYVKDHHRSFKFSYNTILNCRYNLENLQKLSVCYNSVSQDNNHQDLPTGELPFIKKLPNLRELHLDGCWVPVSRPYLATHLKHLEKLSINNVLLGGSINEFAETSIIAELNKLTNLRSLKLKNIIVHKYEELISALDSMHQLERFSIDNRDNSFSALLYNYLNDRHNNNNNNNNNSKNPHLPISQLTMNYHNTESFYNMLTSMGGSIVKLNLRWPSNNISKEDSDRLVSVLSRMKALRVLRSDHIPVDFSPNVFVYEKDKDSKKQKSKKICQHELEEVPDNFHIFRAVAK